VTLVLHVVSTDGERRSTTTPGGGDSSPVPWGYVDRGGGVAYGPGFLLVVAAMACFVAAAAALCLDDAVRAATRALYHCQRRRAPATGQSRLLVHGVTVARNNARCTQARKTTHGLDGQHQDVDRTPRGRVSQNVRGQG